MQVYLIIGCQSASIYVLDCLGRWNVDEELYFEFKFLSSFREAREIVRVFYVSQWLNPSY